MRKRYGITFEDDKHGRPMYAIPTGQMADGSLVWTECTPDKKQLIHEDTQYLLFTRDGYNEFVIL